MTQRKHNTTGDDDRLPPEVENSIINAVSSYILTEHDKFPDETVQAAENTRDKQHREKKRKQ